MSKRVTAESVTLQGIVRFVIAVATIALVFSLLWYFSDVVVYVLISAVLAVMFRPMVALLARSEVRGHIIPRGAAAIITLFVIWAIFGVLFSMLIPLIFSKLSQLTNLDMTSVLSTIEEPVAYVQHYVQNMLSIPESNVDLNAQFVEWLRGVADLDMINSAFSSIVGGFIHFVISFFSISFITFFFLKDDNLFFSIVESLFPSKYSENVSRALNSVTNLLSRYFAGLMAESALIATAVSLVMILFGMRASDAFFMGLIMGVLNVIPYAGPFLGACLSVCLGVISPIESMGVGYTVAVIVCSFMVIKGLDDFMLQPTLYSERVKAHPLEVFIVILLSGYVAGVLGMLLAIPSYTVFRVFAKEFFSQYSLVQKLTKEL